MYDFSDPLVRDLVTRSHVPTEHILATGDGGRQLSLMCEVDHLPWPCPTRQGYLEWEAANVDPFTNGSTSRPTHPLDK